MPKLFLPKVLRYFFIFLSFCVLVACKQSSLSSSATTEKFTVIHSFLGNLDSSYPFSNLILGQDGNYYGTTSQGGNSNLGTVFKITPEGAETIIYSFKGGADGAYPQTALVQDANGNFYGTTVNGGNYDSGTVFKIAANGAETVLYSFGTSHTDGINPYGELTLDADNNTLYGTTSSGGANGDGGTVFSISTNGTSYNILHSFGSGTDGANPYGGVVLDANNNILYGTTSNGGTQSEGTVFSISTSGSYDVLHSFGTGTDGATPEAALILDTNNNILYGTTYYGGNNDDGTVFSISTNGTETVLHSFGTGTDGANPQAALMLDINNNILYGTTYYGGNNDNGTVFSIPIGGGFYTILYSFGSGTDGANPQAGVILNANTLYGTTRQGGTNGEGTVFSIPTSGNSENWLYSLGNILNKDGQNPEPNGALVQDNQGNFYGTTSFGGTYGLGTVFKIAANGAETVLYSFGASDTDGTIPTAGLVLDANNNTLYGTTFYGGANGNGTVFSISTSGSYNILYSFGTGTDGANPYAALLLDANDNTLYGTTANGGANGDGTVFSISTSGANYTPLYSFRGYPMDGANPFAGLVQDANGNLYGTTTNQGINGGGIIFELPASSNYATEKILFSLPGIENGGIAPSGTSLFLDTAGNLYGTTLYGGSSGGGTFFKLTNN